MVYLIEQGGGWGVVCNSLSHECSGQDSQQNYVDLKSPLLATLSELYSPRLLFISTLWQ